MTSSEKIQILQDEFLEAIETKKPEIARRFIIHLTEKQDRDKEDILHSIELLAQQMSSMQKEMNTRFEVVDKRFESVDKRFDDMNKRFDDMNRRFDDMNKRFIQLTWFIGVIFVVLSSMMTLFKLFK